MSGVYAVNDLMSYFILEKSLFHKWEMI